MAIRFVEIHPAEDAEKLNTEWVILHNDGKGPFHTRGCGMTVGRKGSAKKSLLGVIDPGFTLAPGEKMRMCTGSSGQESHGTAPEDDVKNYYLFLPKSYVKGEGTVLTLILRGLQVAKAEFDAKATNGVAVPK
jgi:hypothetical protein